MAKHKTSIIPQFGQIKTASELGHIIRAFRKDKHLTLEKVSGLTHLSMRFLSELERGKESAELGKALELLNKLGLEIIIQPRGDWDQLLKVSNQQAAKQKSKKSNNKGDINEN